MTAVEDFLEAYLKTHLSKREERRRKEKKEEIKNR